MRNPVHQDVLEHAIEVVALARPLVEAVVRRDRNLASQLRRSLSSIVLNLAEGLGTQAGNARLRFETARGSLREAKAALRVAIAWGYV
jgi:four helix bundle protein